MNKFLLYCLSIIDDDVEKSKFEKIYYEHRHAMLYTANQVLHDQILAEDAVQEAFLRIIKHLHKIDEANCHKTKAFLVLIVKNISINMYNKRKRQNEVNLLDEVAEVSVTTDSTSGEDGVQSIVEGIKKLPEMYAHTMALRYLYDLSNQECAQLLKISEITLRKRLERGRKLLKESLQKEEVQQYARF